MRHFLTYKNRGCQDTFDDITEQMSIKLGIFDTHRVSGKLLVVEVTQNDRVRMLVFFPKK